MRRSLSKQDKAYNKKIKNIKTLANKALKEGVKLKCSPGRKFLKDIPIGNLITTGRQEAVLIESTDTSCIVIVTKEINDDAFYLGRKRWAPMTEVEVINWRNGLMNQQKTLNILKIKMNFLKNQEMDGGYQLM